MDAPKDSAKIETQSGSLGETLRAIGQGLEALEVENFALQAEGDGYFVIGTPRTPAPGTAATPPSMKNTFQSAWHTIAERISLNVKASEDGSNVLRVLFTPEGIERLQREGEAKRSEDSGGVPNLSKISQILRMVGEYIDAKSGRLISACKRQDWISFDYETVSQFRITKKWKLSELYEYWLQASNQRQQRYGIVERALGSEREGSSTRSPR